MDEEDIKKITDAFEVTLKNLLNPQPKQEAPKEEKPAEQQKPVEQPKAEAPKPEEHKFYDHGTYKGIDDIINELNELYHPTTHDFLACDVCRPLFEKKVAEIGYDVKEDNGKIIISQKKPQMKK